MAYSTELTNPLLMAQVYNPWQVPNTSIGEYNTGQPQLPTGFGMSGAQPELGMYQPVGIPNRPKQPQGTVVRQFWH